MLVDLLDRCRDRGSHPAVTGPGGTTTSRELADRALRLGSAMRHAGIGRGERVAYLGPTDPTWLAFVLACVRIGAVPTTLNWRLAPRELAAIIDHCDATGLIVDPAMLASLEPAMTRSPQWIRTIGAGTGFEELLAATTAEVDPSPVGETDTAMLIYTSGTTGRPKGVMLSHAALDCFLAGAVTTFELDTSSRGLYMLPLFHIAGGGFALANLVAGSVGVIPPSTDTERLMATISEHRITHLAMVPTLMQAVVDHPRRDAYDLSSIRRVIYGAAPVTPALLGRTLASIGSVFLHTYGLTEAAGFVTALEPDEHDPSVPDRLRSCGRAVPWADIRIADLDAGTPLPSGRRGEIQIGGPSLMRGYLDDPEATAAAFTSDGYLRTGDIGTIDEQGFVFVVDRLKDLIISGGENIAPAEVEAVLAEHPAVAHAAVVGAPDDRWGETVVALVVAQRDAPIDADELIAFARANLAHYKCPRRVDLVDELPMNATGKIDRAALRARVR